MKTIHDKKPEMTEEQKELIATGYVEVFHSDAIIWIGRIKDIPENLKDQVWTKEP